MTELLGRFLGLQSRPPVPSRLPCRGRAWECGLGGTQAVRTGGGRGRPQTSGRTAREPCELQKRSEHRCTCDWPASLSRPQRVPASHAESAGGGHPGSSRRSAKAVAKHVTAHLGADAREAGLLSTPAARRSEPGRARADSHRRQARLLGALKLGLRGTPLGPRVPAVPHVA